MIYVTNSSIVVFVYSRIWSVAMRQEAAEERRQQHQQRASCVASMQRPSVFVVPVDDSVASGNVDVRSERLPPLPENVVMVAVTFSGQSGCWCRRRLARKYRATRTIMVILAAYVVLWFPYFLSRLLSVVVSNPTAQVVVQLFQTIASIVGMMNVGINVFIYTITNSDFRRAFKRLLRIGTTAVHPSHISTIEN